jgi:sulfate transport system permease protein
VIFVSGNKLLDTKIAPVLIVEELESFNYKEATALAVVLLTMSFGLLVLVNLLEQWSKRHAA